MTAFAATKDLYARQQRTKRWLFRLASELHGDWARFALETLHEELDQIASESDQAGDTWHGDAALELSAYLSAFAAHGRRPTASEQDNLLRLTAALAQSADAGIPPASREIVLDTSSNEILQIDGGERIVPWFQDSADLPPPNPDLVAGLPSSV